MSEMKFSQGPWSVSGDGNQAVNSQRKIVDALGGSIASTDYGNGRANGALIVAAR